MYLCLVVTYNCLEVYKVNVTSSDSFAYKKRINKSIYNYIHHIKHLLTNIGKSFFFFWDNSHKEDLFNLYIKSHTHAIS